MTRSPVRTAYHMSQDCTMIRRKGACPCGMLLTIIIIIIIIIIRSYTDSNTDSNTESSTDSNTDSNTDNNVNDNEVIYEVALHPCTYREYVVCSGSTGESGRER